MDKVYSIDYYTFTCDKHITYLENNCPDEKSILFINKLFNALGLNKTYKDFDVKYGGALGFKSYQDIQDGMQIRYCGPKSQYDRPVWRLEIKGRGCDFLKSFKDWYRFFKFVFPLDIHCKRFDPAIDDFEGKEITLDYFYNKIVLGDYILRKRASRKVAPFWSDIKFKDTAIGLSLKFYSTFSDFCFFVYDKAYEQKEKKNYSIPTKQWVRYEMRFFDEKADEVFKNFVAIMFNNFEGDIQYISEEHYESLMGKFLSSLLDSLIKIVDFKDPYRNSWEYDPCWKKFLGDIYSIDFTRITAKRTDVLKKKMWIESSVAKSLLQIFLVQDLDFINLWMRSFMLEQIGNIDDKLLNDVNNERKKIGKDEILKDKISDFTKDLILTNEESNLLDSLWIDKMNGGI